MIIMARRDRSPAAASGCSLVVALALLACAAGVASAAGQARGMPQPARGGAEQHGRGGSAGEEGEEGPASARKGEGGGRAGEGRGRAVRGTEGAPVKKEEAAAQVGLTETAQ